ncbi:MAG: glycosyltransferase, partial [Lactococcus cremoris]
FDFIASNYTPERQEVYKKEILNYLNLKSFEDYFQAGVLVLNLQAIRKDFTTEKFINLVQKRNWIYMDQDILNLCFKNKVFYLPESWNVITLMEKNSVRGQIIQERLPYQISD